MSTEESVARQRERVILRARALGRGGVARVCRELGISRTLFYRWERAYRAYGRDGLRPRPAAPERHPRRLPAHVEDAICALAVEFHEEGPRRIARKLSQPRYGGYRVSPSGVYRCLRRFGLSTRFERRAAAEARSLVQAGLVTERAWRRVRAAEATRRIEASLPGELLCLDAFYVGKLKGVGRLWQFTAVDAATRFAWARLVVHHKTARQAAAFLEEVVLPAFREAGHRVRAVLTDNGAEFVGPAFREALARAGIAHRRTRPRRPQTNGICERFHGTVLHEHYRRAFRRRYYRSASEVQGDLDGFLRYYNFEREHFGRGMDGDIPASRFHGEEVEASA